MIRWQVLECSKCKMPFALTEELHAVALQRREEMLFYCPNGHPQHFVRGESEVAKLRRERDRAIQDQARLAQERDQAMAAADEAERAVKRMKKRASAGVCQCCNRRFANMAAHMRTKHPEFVADNVVKMKNAKAK